MRSAAASSTPEISTQLQIQFQLAPGARRQGKAVKDVKTIGMVQSIDETNYAGIIPIHHGADFHFDDSAPVGGVLTESNTLGIQAGLARDRAKIGNKRRVSGARGSQVLIK